jgi:hypothetical protein
VLRQGARNKEDVDMGQELSGRLEPDHTARVASTHNDTQARLKFISGREHCEDTRKASALGGVFLDSAISHLITSE